MHPHASKDSLNHNYESHVGSGRGAWPATVTGLQRVKHGWVMDAHTHSQANINTSHDERGPTAQSPPTLRVQIPGEGDKLKSHIQLHTEIWSYSPIQLRADFQNDHLGP